MDNPKNPPRESPELSRSFMLRYGCAVVSIALATWVRVLLAPALGGRSPFSTLLFAVLLTAWYGGFRPALVAAIQGRRGTAVGYTIDAGPEAKMEILA